MENQRNLLMIALAILGALLFQKWYEFSQAKTDARTEIVSSASTNVLDANNNQLLTESIPAAPTFGETESGTELLSVEDVLIEDKGKKIIVTTDLIKAWINPKGGVIERVELIEQPVSIDKPEQGFPLLKRTAANTLVAQDGLLVSGHGAPNHLKTDYSYSKASYEIGTAATISVPLKWKSEDGTEYTKTFTFKQGDYKVDINYLVENKTQTAWVGSLYAQFNSSKQREKKGSFGRLPSYVGGAIYTEEEKYEKIKFKDMEKENLSVQTNNGWIAMLQHYFVAAWIPESNVKKQFYSSITDTTANTQYRIGYKTIEPIQIAAQQSGNVGTSVYLGSKDQAMLKRTQKESNIKGLALTVDYGMLTFIADPLFSVLSWIHKIVNNWGWSIILLTMLIKLAFYPLSAASYKSMAGMKKIQPRLQTLKERYKDDRPKFQSEMMALYKKEKINPAGGCLPILIQIPVFIALYWVLLESVEMRHAPFALWLQDLSAPDPYKVLPVLMGITMFLQQKLNPAPMEDMQKKIMMFMPIGLTFLFLSFPQGLVLYWVVNNILSIIQQWWINKKYANA